MHVHSSKATGTPEKPEPERWPDNKVVDVPGAIEPLVKQVVELNALYKLTDRLYRARTLNDALDAAIDAIISTPGCRRAK